MRDRMPLFTGGVVEREPRPRRPRRLREPRWQWVWRWRSSAHLRPAATALDEMWTRTEFVAGTRDAAAGKDASIRTPNWA